VLQILSFVAQNERDAIRKRQSEGIAAAKARGVHMGRPVKRPPEDFAALVRRWEHGKMSIQEFMAQTGMKESTLYRRIREFQAVRRK